VARPNDMFRTSAHCGSVFKLWLQGASLNSLVPPQASDILFSERPGSVVGSHFFYRTSICIRYDGYFRKDYETI
jgi:hypothetical protein